MCDYYLILGCAYECPVRKRTVDCPFNEVENLTFKEKVNWINNNSLEKNDSILKYHIHCSKKRKNK